MPHGQGTRCYGYQQGEWVHCTRPEMAGALRATQNDTYAHRLDRPCKCGMTHGTPLSPTGEGRAASGGRRSSSPPPWCDPAYSRTATFDYRDEGGLLLYQVERYERVDGIPGKLFLQCRPLENGKRTYKLGDTRRVLYRLPELLASLVFHPIFVVEGEKHVDALLRLGLVATTNPGGAGKGKWLADYSSYFAGRTAILLPDNDAVGMRHMEGVRDSLWANAPRVKVRYIKLNVPEKGDVLDWLASGGTAAELVYMAGHMPLWPPADGMLRSSLTASFVKDSATGALCRTVTTQHRHEATIQIGAPA
jgi:hypothetical protein